MIILFIGAHPDDEMSCLGTLLRYHKRGDRIALVCATNGDKGISDDPGVPYAECAQIRDSEMRAVAESLKADYQCLGESDEALFDTPAPCFETPLWPCGKLPFIACAMYQDDYSGFFP